MTITRPAWAYTLPAALLLMAPFDILASLAMDIYLPVVPAMPGILNTTPAMIQLTLSLYIVMLGVGQVIFGPLSDRIGRRPILLAGATAFVIASLGAAWSSTAPAFVAFRLLQAVGASAMLVATFATVRDVYAVRQQPLEDRVLKEFPSLFPEGSSAYEWRGERELDSQYYPDRRRSEQAPHQRQAAKDVHSEV